MTVCEITGCGQSSRFRDHCHAHGVVRGDLCASCNTRMGYVDKSPAHRLAGVNSVFRDYWLRCPGCQADSAGWWPAGIPAVLLPPATPAWTSRISMTATREMKHDLEAARIDDGIEVTARLRAMITLWQEDPQLRGRVDELARGLR